MLSSPRKNGLDSLFKEVSLQGKYCDPSDHLQESRVPSAQDDKKQSQNKSFGGSAK